MTQRADKSPAVATPWISPRRVVDTAHGISLQEGATPRRTLAELQGRAAAPAAATALPAHTQVTLAAHTLQRTATLADAPVQIGCRGLFKSYQKGGFGIPVLQGIDLDVREGEFVAIIGQSGCGKSTLLHLLGTLDGPDAGAVQFEGNRIDNLPSRSRDILRNSYFGMIFQFYHLLPELTTLENILAPALIAESTLSYWMRRGAHRQRAYDLMDLLGIAHRAKHKPREMSGGELQRAAIGRALLSRPKVLLADEPTGNLDRATGEQIMQTLREIHERENLTIVMVTHDPWIAGQADRTVKLVEGRIQKG